MLIEVSADGWLSWAGGRMRAALGRNGVTDHKCEGDGATPAGSFRLRQVLYRADRLQPPATLLQCSVIRPDCGWSDDPADADYNRRVRLPHRGGHEKLWREDGLYDLLVPLGYNDDPVVPGAGSTIFLHISRPDYGPTQGCVALRREDLLTILRSCGSESWMTIRSPDPEYDE